eukprot:2882469-Pleurochrysis_carterae.AAC.5
MAENEPTTDTYSGKTQLVDTTNQDGAEIEQRAKADRYGAESRTGKRVCEKTSTGNTPQHEPKADRLVAAPEREEYRTSSGRYTDTDPKDVDAFALRSLNRCMSKNEP